MKAMKKQLIIPIVMLVLVSSCKIVRPYQEPEISQPVQQQLYRDQHQKDTVSIAGIPWKQFFQDSTLQGYIEEGLSNNYSMRTALENIAIAQASFKQSKQALLPSLYFDPNFTFNQQSKAALNFPSTVNIKLRTSTLQLPVGTSWEIDIWGKLASSKRAAMADYLQTEASTKAVQTQLIADIATYYYQLLAYKNQLSITQQTILLREKDVVALREMKSASLINGAALAQNEANLYAASVSIPELQQRIRETENALSVLLGRVPGPIACGNMDEQTETSPLTVGIPLYMIQNRPDVAAAQYAFQSAFESTNVAHANFYPSLTITGKSGLSALTTNSLGANAFFLSLVGDLMQPIYNKGINRANLKRAEARQQQALFTFQQTILVAGREVSDALYAYEICGTRTSIRQKQITALAQSVDFTKELLTNNSATNYNDVITAEQALLSAQLSAVNDQLQKKLALVSLYHALGGGWH